MFRYMVFFAVVWPMSLLSATSISVGVNGKPDGDGSPERPAATLAQAVLLARQAGAKHITIGPGEYFDTFVTLDHRDTGLTIEGQGATLYGGVPVKPISREADLLYFPAPGATPVRVLLVDGVLATRARFPETGALQHLTDFPVPWMSTTEGGWQRKPTDEELTTMKFAPADLPRTLSARNAEVTVYHMWDESCVPLESIDFDKGLMRFAAKTGHPAGAFGVKKYVIWNTKEGLTAPGMFYHDRGNGRLVYRARPGETPSRVIAATQSSIIRLRGTEKEALRDVTLKNLRLQVTTAPIISGGFGALAFSGAVDLQRCRGISISNLSISNCAGYAINSGWVNLADSSVQDCTIEHCGAGGMCVRGDRITVRNNSVKHTGLYFPSGVAIFGGGKDCAIENNHVEDCSYSGIACSGERNAVRRNLIIKAMRDLFDGGAIYASSAKNSVIEENVCRDIGGKGGYSRVGYYLDEQSENTVVRRNIALDVDVPLQNHMTRACVMEENVMINQGDLCVHSARCEGLTLRGNVAWAGGKMVVSGVNAYSTLSKNILFSKSDKYEFFSLDKYRKTTTGPAAPEGIQNVDPGFADFPTLRYRADSPARAMSLPALDASLAGVRPK